LTASLLAGLDLDLQWRLVRRLVVNLERRVVQAESLLDELLQHAAPVVAVVARPYDDVRRERGEAGGDLPDVRSWTSTTPGCAASVRPTSSGSMSAGAASMNTLPEALSSA